MRLSFPTQHSAEREHCNGVTEALPLGPKASYVWQSPAAVHWPSRTCVLLSDLVTFQFPFLLSKPMYSQERTIKLPETALQVLKSQAKVPAESALGSFPLEMLNLTWFGLYAFHLGKGTKAKSELTI